MILKVSFLKFMFCLKIILKFKKNEYFKYLTSIAVNYINSSFFLIFNELCFILEEVKKKNSIILKYSNLYFKQKFISRENKY